EERCVRQLSFGDRSDWLLARELRCHRRLADLRRNGECRRADGNHAQRRKDRWAPRLAEGIAREAGTISTHGHRETHGVCAREDARVLRSARRADDRARRRSRRLPLVVDHLGNRQESGVLDPRIPGDIELVDTTQETKMTFLTAKALPRRTVLRGLGATVALPFLDAMLPAASIRARAAGAPVHRFQTFYVPNGMAMEYWTPKGIGNAFELSPILEPLASFRNQLVVLSGLKANWNYIHAGASGSFLTGTTR